MKAKESIFQRLALWRYPALSERESVPHKATDNHYP